MDQLKVIQKFRGAAHCKAVHLLEGNIVKKKYSSKKVFKRELHALQTLQKYDFIPRLIDFEVPKTIYMSFCGTKININTFVKQSKQIDQMMKLIQTDKIYHNDLKPRNVCIHHGKLFLIDFSWATKHKGTGPGLNKVKHYINRIHRY